MNNSDRQQIIQYKRNITELLENIYLYAMMKDFLQFQDHLKESQSNQNLQIK